MAVDYQQILIDIIKAKPETEAELSAAVRQATSKLKLAPPPKSILIQAYHKLIKSGKIKSNKKFEQLLTKRAIRTLSGVAVVSVLTKPYPCTGHCLFCPTEAKMPKSYLSNEPAVKRAIMNDFDPYRQVAMRLAALSANNHSVDKIELIVMGGTWSCLPAKYQDWFIKRCFDAVNGRSSPTMAAAQKVNESAKRRVIGLTLETRPDYITPEEISRFRKLGCTRVELGIQHTEDEILKLNRRGHDSQQGIRAIKLLKDSGFKINLHFMLNLYGSTPAQDLAMFKKIYAGPEYAPDMVKIYPCVVNEHAQLHKIYLQGKYKPYSDKQLAGLIMRIKRLTPPWVRITRLIRDIPEESIVAGNKITNLRQLVGQTIASEDWSCQCIRCREAGHQKELGIKNYELRIIKYKASEGQEYFLSFESIDGKILYAFLRLRINDKPEENFIPELRGAALVRELHTYGQAAEIGSRGDVQHLGLGKKLLQEAEKITRQHQLKKIAVIAGIGVRNYYKKSGYRINGTYMVKKIDKFA